MHDSFRKAVGWLSVLSVPFAIANFGLTSMASMTGSADTLDFTDLGHFLEAGAGAGHLMKWAWLADLLGYYLLLVPAAFLLHHWLKNNNPYWIGIFTFCGLAYLFAGCIGAAILAKTWPPLMSAYANADGPIRETYRIVFTHSTDLVNGGIWGYLEFLLAGIWWTGVGFTMRSERKALGMLTILLGGFSTLASLGHIFAVIPVANVGLAVYLLLSPVWAFWLGVSAIRGKGMKLSLPG